MARPMAELKFLFIALVPRCTCLSGGAEGAAALWVLTVSPLNYVVLFWEYKALIA